MFELSGERIILRSYSLEDADLIILWRNDKETTQYLGRIFRKNRSLAELKTIVQETMENQNETRWNYVIAEKETRKYLGGIDLTDIDRHDKNAVLSIVIGDATKRNKGYGTEAILLLLKYAFGALGLHRVSLNVWEGNPMALQCYKKIGFKEEGRLRDYRNDNGVYSDMIQMGILDHEFIKKNQRN